MNPNDCALVIGVTYFLSSILGLVLKKHVGRRVLLLASELGMAVSQIAMGIYFYVLTGTSKDELRYDTRQDGFKIRVYGFPVFFISRETGNFQPHFPGTREFPGNAFIKYLYKEKYEKSGVLTFCHPKLEKIVICFKLLGCE